MCSYLHMPALGKGGNVKGPAQFCARNGQDRTGQVGFHSLHGAEWWWEIYDSWKRLVDVVTSVGRFQSWKCRSGWLGG